MSAFGNYKDNMTSVAGIEDYPQRFQLKLYHFFFSNVAPSLKAISDVIRSTEPKAGKRNGLVLENAKSFEKRQCIQILGASAAPDMKMPVSEQRAWERSYLDADSAACGCSGRTESDVRPHISFALADSSYCRSPQQIIAHKLVGIYSAFWWPWYVLLFGFEWDMCLNGLVDRHVEAQRVGALGDLASANVYGPRWSVRRDTHGGQFATFGICVCTAKLRKMERNSQLTVPSQHISAEIESMSVAHNEAIPGLLWEK
ncbi:hypothetical protein MKZ38_000516 [Zalerion maritima]|uniref:Uncharacterized protein n=1 Tax=Zalerion maritima TaxID=339359 RepID=A0AAD5RF92_9PEZI|nr:hypothetical protein MKZ38_000516 [Zalerion maritima]